MDPVQRSWQTLEVERDGPVLRVWFNRPDRRNALNATALEEVETLFTGLQSDFETRVVVLGGRGISFCAGADRTDPPGSVAFKTSAGGNERKRRFLLQLGLRAARAVEDTEVVTVARIQGHAVGGGCVLAAACDFRIATHGTKFHVPEVDLGIPLTWGATPRLIQEIGAARTRELILLCDPVDGRTAASWGLAHRSVEEADLDTEVERWVSRILGLPEVAVHMTKTQLRAYALRARLGDVTETDGDILGAASRGSAARTRFQPLGKTEKGE